MQIIETIYRETVMPLPDAEKLQLAARILNDLSKSQTTGRRSAVDLLDAMPAARLFKTSDEADDYLRQERKSWNI